RMPRTPAVIVVVLLAFAAIFAFGAVVAGQVTQLAGNLPAYQTNIETKIKTLRGNFAGGGLFERASTMLQRLNEEIARPEPAPVPAGQGSAERATDEVEPIPVRVQQAEP